MQNAFHAEAAPIVMVATPGGSVSRRIPKLGLSGIAAPVLVMAGDRDVVTVSHSEWLTRQLSKGQLCVLPRTDHLASVSRSAWVLPILRGEDLDAPLPMDAAHP